MNKPRRVKPQKFDLVAESQLVMRFADIRRGTADSDTRSVEVVVATENPVERYDDERGIVVHEVLEMDGLVLRGGRNQLPIVDSHDRSTVANVLGSVRDLHISGDELVGRAYFASDQASQEAYQKLIDGHLTDFSITASPKQVAFVERGREYVSKRGATIQGPADIVKSWMPTDASLVATGADERSVVRRSYIDIPREVTRMDEAMLGQLQKLGMPAEIVDPNAAMAWVLGYLTEQQSMPMVESAEEVPEEEIVEQEDGDESPAVTEEEVEKADDGEPEMADLEKAVDRALKADRERQREIRAICRKAGLDRDFADDLCDNNVSLDIARQQILDKLSERNQALGTTTERVDVKVTESSDDKFYAAARDGVLTRAYRSAGVRRTVDSPASGFEDFEHVRLSRLAETFAQRMGAKVERMAPKDIALIAMGHPGALSRHRISREAYHTTGSFANLMLDAANKTLLAAYEEAPYTWGIWARQATSVADFKDINRIRFGEVASPEMVPENQDYPETPMVDAKETYKIHKYGNVFTVTWETVVNDDLDAISRIPAMQGAACRRKQNAAVYAVLTANATMSDTGALFNTTAQTTAGGHANLAASAAAPSVTTLNAGFVSMMTKTGQTVNGVAGPILNIQPSYIIVPVALSATTLQLVGSIADPSNAAASTEDATRPNYNANTLNIYGPNGSRPLNVVVEPVLDGNSTTAWYLAANASQIDTVELTFLAGEESPVLENEWDFDKDVYKYKVRQTFGTAPIDFRGLYKNAGA